MEHRFLTVTQAADMLQLDPDTVRLLARRGQVPAAKVGRQWRFDAGLLRDWLREKSLQRGKKVSLEVSARARRGKARAARSGR